MVCHSPYRPDIQATSRHRVVLRSRHRLRGSGAGGPAAAADAEEQGERDEGGGGPWFNLRPSHTEPLLHLNVEARDALTMIAVRDEILDLARDGWRRIRHSASPRTPVPTELMVPVPWSACERQRPDPRRGSGP